MCKSGVCDTKPAISLKRCSLESKLLQSVYRKLCTAYRSGNLAWPITEVKIMSSSIHIPLTHAPWGKPAPETGARKLASVSGASVIQSGARFFWRQILESDRTCSISRQNMATTWSKYWFVIGQCSMLLLFSFVGVVNFGYIFDYSNYLTYSVYLTWVGRIAR